MDFCKNVRKHWNIIFSKEILSGMTQKKQMLLFPQDGVVLYEKDAENWINGHSLMDRKERILLRWARDKSGKTGYVIKHVYDLGTITASDEYIRYLATGETPNRRV